MSDGLRDRSGRPVRSGRVGGAATIGALSTPGDGSWRWTEKREGPMALTEGSEDTRAEEDGSDRVGALRGAGV